MSEENNAPAFSEAQMTALTELIAKTTAPIINSAVTSHLKRQPNVADEIKKALTKEALQPIFSELVEDLPDGGDGGGDPGAGGGKGGNQPAKPDPKMSALEAKVQELTTKLQQDADALKKAQDAARDKDALAALKTALGPLVRPEALEIAARDLFLAQKRVTFDDQGNPLFTVRKAPYTGGAEEDVPLPLTDGVQHWIKSDEGKFFAPAPGANPQQRGGSPAPRGGARTSDGLPVYDKPATNDTERQRRVEERSAAIRQKFPDRFGGT